MDVRCTVESDNLIIYGHNINGRRYFGYLQNFREEIFFKQHPKFSFTAVGEKEKEYYVVSVLETDKYAEYCLKMGVIASSVKMSDSVMQKAFGL